MVLASEAEGHAVDVTRARRAARQGADEPEQAGQVAEPSPAYLPINEATQRRSASSG